MQPPIRQGPEHIGIEIDHGDLIEQGFVTAPDLAQQGAGGAEKAEDHDPPRFAVAAFVAGIVAVVEVAHTDPLQGADASRVIWSLRMIANVLSTARTTNAKDVALAVWVRIWPAATPVWITPARTR